MQTVVVWVLVLTFTGFKSGGPVVIDNIASKQNCEALGAYLARSWDGREDRFRVDRFRCVAVRKEASQ